MKLLVSLLVTVLFVSCGSETQWRTLEEENIISNLPAQKDVLWGRSGSFQVEVSETEPAGQEIIWSIDISSCSFDVEVSPTGLVNWNCGDPEVCKVDVMATYGGETPESSKARLMINSYNNPPVIDSVPSQSIMEHVEYVYDITATDSDGDPVTITDDSVNSCGGTFVDNGDGTAKYVFTPGEALGGRECELNFICNDTADETVQNTVISILEVNSVPTIEPVDDFLVFWGRGATYDIQYNDSDTPVQTMTWSIQNNDCSFTPEIDSNGTLTFVSGNPEVCGFDVVAEDNGSPVKTASTPVSVISTNTPPRILTEPESKKFRTNMTYKYELFGKDPENDNLVISVDATDTCGGVIVDNGDGSGIYSLNPKGVAESTCDMVISCSDGIETVTQTTTLTKGDKAELQLIDVNQTSYNIQPRDLTFVGTTLFFSGYNEATCG